MVLLDVCLSVSETSNVTTDMGADSEGHCALKGLQQATGRLPRDQAVQLSM